MNIMLLEVYDSFLFPLHAVLIELLCLKSQYRYDGDTGDSKSNWHILHNLTASRWQINFEQTIRNEIETKGRIMQHFARVAIS